MSRVSLEGIEVLEKRVLLVGFGVVGKEVYQAVLETGGLVIAVVDDHYENATANEGICFHKIEFLEQAILEHSPDLVLVSATLLPAQQIHKITQVAAKVGVSLVIVPERAEFHVNEEGSINLRTPSLEDIFARTSFLIDYSKIRRHLEGARVLVSGAGGSIGSRIAMQALSMGARSVGLLDRDDCLLHDIAVEISGKMHNAKTPLYVKDIQFENPLDEVFNHFRPNIVIHAAAQKHVTTLEDSPQNALAINVLGTLNMLEKSERYGVREFLNISSDKAASQENILGLTKYLGERMTAGSNIERKKSVRFGNVLGSRASVLHTFRIQAKYHKKLTVRGEETTRFFMTNNEAASLSLSTLAAFESQGTFVLNMGKPVRILDLASEISRTESCEIAVEELRSGEVVHEQLFRPEERPHETTLENVLKVEPEPLSIERAKQILGKVEGIYGMTTKQAREMIKELLAI